MFQTIGQLALPSLSSGISPHGAHSSQEMSCFCASSPKYLWVTTIIHYYDITLHYMGRWIKTVLIFVSPTRQHCLPLWTASCHVLTDSPGHGWFSADLNRARSRVATAWRKGVKDAVVTCCYWLKMWSTCTLRLMLQAPKLTKMCDSPWTLTSKFEWYTLLLEACSVCICICSWAAWKMDRTWFVNDISMGWCHDWSCLTSNSYIYIYCTVLVTYTHLPFWRHPFKMESHLPNSFPAGITEVWPLAYLILSPHFCKYFTPGNKHGLITN